MRISDWSSDVCSSDLREHRVEDDDEEDRGDHRRGRALPDLFGILAHLHPLIASGDADQYAEHRRLDQHDPEIGHRDDFAQALNIGEGWNIEPDTAEESDRKSTRLNSSH